MLTWQSEFCMKWYFFNKRERDLIMDHSCEWWALNGEIAYLTILLIFPQCFQNHLLLRHQNVCVVGKGFTWHLILIEFSALKPYLFNNSQSPCVTVSMCHSLYVSVSMSQFPCKKCLTKCSNNCFACSQFNSALFRKLEVYAENNFFCSNSILKVVCIFFVYQG